MSGEEKNKLDELFKNGLDKPDTHFEFNDQDWDNLEQMLDENSRPRRGIIYWLPALSGVAAILLIFLGWWLFKPANVTQQTQQVAVKQILSKPPVDNNVLANNHPDANQASHIKNDSTTIKNETSTIAVNKNVTPKRQTIPAYAVGAAANNYGQGTGAGGDVVKGSNTANSGINHQSSLGRLTDLSHGDALVAVADNQISASAKANIDNSGIVNNMADDLAAFTAERNKQALKSSEAIVGTKNKSTLAFNKGPKMGLAMLVSPDINGVGSFQNAKVGTNIGLQFSIGITSRFTITTGAGYSKKPYVTDFTNYHTGYQFKTNPEDVYADCRVLDIPINLDYKLFSKNRNSFSIGSGLSSYIMLKEKYTYDYAIPGTSGPTNYIVTNKNRHILGVLNLNATYAHQLNSKFSIAAQPYLKLPLTDIGYSQVKLQSAGVAVGLRWNINQ